MKTNQLADKLISTGVEFEYILNDEYGVEWFSNSKMKQIYKIGSRQARVMTDEWRKEHREIRKTNRELFDKLKKERIDYINEKYNSIHGKIYQTDGGSILLTKQFVTYGQSVDGIGKERVLRGYYLSK